MSALDDVLFAAHLAGTGGTATAARAELALLRRCREAVVALAALRHGGHSWWFRHGTRQDQCVVCSDVATYEGVITHAVDCPALAIDALAKEVRGE